jgi:hypothetical protein
VRGNAVRVSNEPSRRALVSRSVAASTDENTVNCVRLADSHHIRPLAALEQTGVLGARGAGD